MTKAVLFTDETELVVHRAEVGQLVLVMAMWKALWIPKAVGAFAVRKRGGGCVVT